MSMVDERAVRLALDAGRANLRRVELTADNGILRLQVEQLTDAAARREQELNEAWDEVERLHGLVERLQVEKHDLIERLIQMGGGPS